MLFQKPGGAHGSSSLQLNAEALAFPYQVIDDTPQVSPTGGPGSQGDRASWL
jgi:hypothetical protein